MNSKEEEYKQQVYKKWIDNGRPWFHIDKSKEPTYAEKQIILEMNKQERQQPTSYTVKDHSDNKIYTVTETGIENKPQTQQQQYIPTEEEKARFVKKMLGQNKEQTKQDKELEKRRVNNEVKRFDRLMKGEL